MIGMEWDEPDDPGDEMTALFVLCGEINIIPELVSHAPFKMELKQGYMYRARKKSLYVVW